MFWPTGGEYGVGRLGASGRQPYHAAVDGWERVSHGHTDAVVRRSPDGRSYAKTASGPARAELTDEHERLQWLATTDLPAPRVLDWDDDGTTATLTTAAVPGVALSELPRSSVADGARAFGEFLRRLHAVDRESCPFDRWLAVTVPLALLRVEEGLVDDGDFDADRQGSTARESLDDLLERRPRAEALETPDLVVCHGDACLPNVLVDPETFAVTGMIDVGRLGVADRHLDLALAVRSVSDTSLNPGYGPDVADAVLAAYGRQADPWRLDFYRLLDEFF
jgi:kanamycin kinase/streptomycin 3"-kinase/aminoglycoside 3'-phosphotransferase-2